MSIKMRVFILVAMISTAHSASVFNGSVTNTSKTKSIQLECLEQFQNACSQVRPYLKYTESQDAIVLGRTIDLYVFNVEALTPSGYVSDPNYLRAFESAVEACTGGNDLAGNCLFPLFAIPYIVTFAIDGTLFPARYIKWVTENFSKSSQVKKTKKLLIKTIPVLVGSEEKTVTLSDEDFDRMLLILKF